MPSDDDEDMKYPRGKRVPIAEYIQAVAKHGPCSTNDVANTVGVTRKAAEYRLKRLRDDGRVNGDMIGNSLVWTLSDGDEQ